MVRSIGIIGAGVVGKTFGEYWKKNGVGVYYYDKDQSKVLSTMVDSVNELCALCDMVFICIPTPCAGTSFDLEEISKILREIDSPQRRGYPVVVRSTLVPGSMDKLQTEYPNLGLCYYPEFLTERYATRDVSNPTKFIVGYRSFNTYSQRCKLLLGILLTRYVQINPAFYNTVPLFTMSFEQAETVKILTNAFYAAKVSLFNELRAICESFCGDGSWEDVRHCMIYGSMIHPSHTEVPGHDGKRGFGGKCLPKDLRGLLTALENVNLESKQFLAPILDAVQRRNDTIDRPD